MAISSENLNKNFIVVDERATILEVRKQVRATNNNWTYIVVLLNGGKCAVLRLTDIIYALQDLGRSSSLLELSLATTPGLLESRLSTPIQQSSVSRSEAQRLVSAAPGKRLAVMADAKMIGVLANESRSLDQETNTAWLDTLSDEPQPGAPMPAPRAASSSSPVPSPEAGGSTAPYPDDELAQFHTGTERPITVKQPLHIARTSSGVEMLNDRDPEKRWINAEIQGQEPTSSLEVGRIYKLAFDVDQIVREKSLVQAVLLGYQFKKEERSVELTVQLSSDDFRIHSGPQKLVVLYAGKSKDPAVFEVEPKQEGEGIINAVFLKDGNFIQLLTLRLNAGSSQSITSESMSRPLDAALTVQPRDLSLVIMNVGNGFKVILTGAVYTEATLPITLPELDQMIAQARTALREVVNLESGPKRETIYQRTIDIPPEINRVALKHLAETGFLLFQQMFYGAAADSQANLLGDKLREMAQKQRLKIQIVSQQFLLPWGLLYLATDFDPENIDPELFLGLKHIIEHIPLQPSMEVVDSTINSQPNLTVSLNLNRDIDEQMGAPLIADQLNYWARISHQGKARTILRQSAEEVEQSLADCSGEQIFYFYCHAASTGLSESGGPDSSSLNLGGNKSLTLRQLKLRAPARKALPNSPLVFINACESAELSPLFYGGFVPYFMAKGARGVIGTECETPAIFASAWAHRFFDNFLAGEPLGKLFLDLRREFYYQHNNLMGLLYAIYCDGDTQIVPGVTVSPT